MAFTQHGTNDRPFSPKQSEFFLREYQIWIWFIDYIPMIGFIVSLGFFWRKYVKARKNNELKLGNDYWIYH